MRTALVQTYTVIINASEDIIRWVSPVFQIEEKSAIFGFRDGNHSQTSGNVLYHQEMIFANLFMLRLPAQLQIAAELE